MNYFKGRWFRVAESAWDCGAEIDSVTFRLPPHPRIGEVGLCLIEPSDTIVLLRFPDGGHDTFEARHLVLIPDPSAPVQPEA